MWIATLPSFIFHRFPSFSFGHCERCWTSLIAKNGFVQNEAKITTTKKSKWKTRNWRGKREKQNTKQTNKSHKMNWWMQSVEVNCNNRNNLHSIHYIVWFLQFCSSVVDYFIFILNFFFFSCIIFQWSGI